MNKRRTGNEYPRCRKRIITLLLIVAYLLVLLLGCFVIWAIPYAKNRDDLMEIAADKGKWILSVGEMDPVLLYGMEHWFIDEQGRVVANETIFLHKSQKEDIRALYSDVLEDGELFLPAFFLIDNRDDDPAWVFGIIAGTVVESSGGKQFASILLRDLSDLDITMVTYIALFSILYLVGCTFAIAVVRKEREVHRMQRDLIANVSHELKTPITAIRAMAETLHDGLIQDPQTKHLYSGKIIEESDQLEKLVLDILELSKLQSNWVEFKCVEAYADGIIPPIIDRYMMLCGDLDISLDTSKLELEAVPVLCTDVEKLVTLISILMDNAVKFTGAGGTIWLSNQIHSKNVTFCIRDNGPGIREEDINRIFERFYKADISHNSSGSGLGLAIAAEIAKGLGEKLWVESKYGEGSAFYFTVGFQH